jgi:hypothetical protein
LWTQEIEINLEVIKDSSRGEEVKSVDVYNPNSGKDTAIISFFLSSGGGG